MKESWNTFNEIALMLPKVDLQSIGNCRFAFAEVPIQIIEGALKCAVNEILYGAGLLRRLRIDASLRFGGDDRKRIRRERAQSLNNAGDLLRSSILEILVMAAVLDLLFVPERQECWELN